MSLNIRADTWNDLIRVVMRARVVAGIGCETKQTSNGCILSGDAIGRWRHPWQVSARWNYDDTIQPLGGQWVGMVRPGFVNAQDVTIEVERATEIKGQIKRVPVPLTDEEPPELVFGGFRDPAAPGGVEASLSGDIIVKPGEGYSSGRP